MIRNIDNLLSRFVDKAAERISQQPLLGSNLVIPALAAAALLKLQRLAFAKPTPPATRRVLSRKRGSPSSTAGETSFEDSSEQDLSVHEPSDTEELSDREPSEQELMFFKEKESKNRQIALIKHMDTLDKKIVKQQLEQELSFAKEMSHHEIDLAKHWVRPDDTAKTEKVSNVTSKGSVLHCEISHISKDAHSERASHYIGSLELEFEKAPIFAIFDGDGDPLAVEFAKAHFDQILRSELEKGEDSTVDTWNALMRASLQFKERFFEGHGRDFAKTSMAFALLREKYIWVVSMGDIRVFLDLGEQSVPLAAFQPDRKASALINGVEIQLNAAFSEEMRPQITRFPIEQLVPGSRLIFFSAGVAEVDIHRNRSTMVVDLKPIVPDRMGRALALLKGFF